MNEETKLIVLTDILENKVRKEKELEYYQQELEKLQQKMFFIKKDIEVTNLIIDMIKHETVIDLSEQAEKKLLIKPEKDD